MKIKLMCVPHVAKQNERVLKVKSNESYTTEYMNIKY